MLSIGDEIRVCEIYTPLKPIYVKTIEFLVKVIVHLIHLFYWIINGFPDLARCRFYILDEVIYVTPSYVNFLIFPQRAVEFRLQSACYLVHFFYGWGRLRRLINAVPLHFPEFSQSCQHLLLIIAIREILLRKSYVALLTFDAYVLLILWIPLSCLRQRPIRSGLLLLPGPFGGIEFVFGRIECVFVKEIDLTHYKLWNVYNYWNQRNRR